jgi:hypothetical protein
MIQSLRDSYVVQFSEHNAPTATAIAPASSGHHSATAIPGCFRAFPKAITQFRLPCWTLPTADVEQIRVLVLAPMNTPH